MQVILIILGIYLLYKFMTDFVIPIYRTTKRVQEQFRDVQQRANQHVNPQQNSYKSSPVDTSTNTTSKTSSKDYIDFEEIKD
jgi:hypothetical protein